MPTYRIAALAFAFAFSVTAPVFSSAEETTAAGSTASAEDQRAQQRAYIEEIEKSLHYQSGHVGLPNNKAELDLPKDYVYLSPEDARKVIEEVWGNPPGSGDDVLGMILPSAGHLGADSWGAVLTYKADGHVSDKDANDINYDDLLKELKKSSEEANASREKAGYGSMRLVGWAVPPRYDSAVHTLHWAKEFRVSDGPDALNYDVRVLGREGVLSLIVVASKSQLDSLQGAINDLPKIARFTSGNRYDDFNKATDRVAEYGIAALVAGGTAVAVLKAGKLAFLLILLKKFGVVLVAGLEFAWRWIKGIFGGAKAG